ncbi:MAG: molybdate ABC transporter substrate-binding protein [Chloroflexota bacterium]|nr:MAG: molybdate ABC transporter substrate-binding protein [Chloroflexota bacterium]
MFWRAIGLAIIAVAMLAIGCARQSDDLMVFAASSLVDVASEIASAYEPTIRPAHVVVHTGATSQLRAQLEQGARADVFLLASAEQAEAAQAVGLIEAPRVFARTRLILAVSSGSDAPAILEDLARPTTRVVMSPIDVPIGAYARASLRRMSADSRFGADFANRVLANVRSEEPNARQQFAKVRLGEANAAFAYATDVADGESGIRVIEIPERFNVMVAYAAGTIVASRQPERARAFVTYLVGVEARQVFRRHGFDDP